MSSCDFLCTSAKQRGTRITWTGQRERERESDGVQSCQSRQREGRTNKLFFFHLYCLSPSSSSQKRFCCFHSASLSMRRLRGQQHMKHFQVGSFLFPLFWFICSHESVEHELPLLFIFPAGSAPTGVTFSCSAIAVLTPEHQVSN